MADVDKADSGSTKPQTITGLARKFGLSRSTLLYYDSIGLLRPVRRSRGRYRLYDDQDVARLERICTYRKAGLPLDEIACVLGGESSKLQDALARRLEALNGEIATLREQQRFILGILRGDAHRRIGVMSKRTWTKLLAASGFSEQDMFAWHAAFERSAPDEHEEFLRFLCIPDGEIRRIRERATKAAGSAVDG